MLGIDKSTLPVIEDVFAQEMREALRRRTDNQPNASELQDVERSEEVKSKYHAVWK